MSSSDLASAFARVSELAARAGLPGVEHGTSYGTPALKVKGKMFVRIKDSDTIVVMCDLDEKEILMQAAPEIYFETDHYKGWPAVLVRLSNIDSEELTECLERAWRRQAPKNLVQQLDGR